MQNAAAMELTFVHQFSGESPKRRRLAKACESCRARKKRCVHFAGADGEGSGYHRPSMLSMNGLSDHAGDDDGGNRRSSESSSDSDLSPTDTPRRVSRRSIGIVKPGATQQQPQKSPASGRARFISDLNPESTLLNRPVPATDSSRKQPNDDIGVWVDRRELDALIKQRNDGSNSTNQPLVMNYGFRHGQRPHSAVLGPLIDIYFKKIHPLLPLLDEDEFRQNHAGGHIPEALVHAMCLAAAKDSEAEPHLRLSDSPATVPSRQFCTILHASVTGALRVPVRFEKITLIRTLALASLHVEGAEGTEEASLWLAQALHYSTTLGIHLGQQASPPAKNDLILKRLFWSLWALDRTTATLSGRPIMLSDIDIAIDTFAPGESGYPAFEAWLKIAGILNKIIDMYRPTSDPSSTGWEDAYPTFEGIVDEVNGWQGLSPSILATIHLFYLSVGVLSHRTRGIKQLPCVNSSHLRQRLFSIEIIRLMNAPKSQTLHPLPILPYAISMALSVSYQHLRQSQLEHQQADARQDFRIACRILQNLRRTWCQADLIASLAKKVLDELDRAPSLASFRIPRTRNPYEVQKVVANLEQDVIPPPTACSLVGVGPPREHQSAGVNGEIDETGQVLAPDPLIGQQQPPLDGLNLFDNMDDVFGTFMDPNYPLNLEDMSFVDELPSLEWDTEAAVGS